MKFHILKRKNCWGVAFSPMKFHILKRKKLLEVRGVDGLRPYPYRHSTVWKSTVLEKAVASISRFAPEKKEYEFNYLEGRGDRVLIRL